MTLTKLGWNARFGAAFEALEKTEPLAPARVLREDRDRYRIACEDGERPATLAGRLRHEVTDRVALPAVGDWVAIRTDEASDRESPATIVAVLPRSSAFVRKDAGETTESQVLVANVDTVFLVTGLDGDFNVRRIERYLAAAWESGAEPVVLLNKADVAADLPARLAEVEAVAMGVPIVTLSALNGSGLEALAPWITPGRTIALLGSSGVGKSTIVNALAGESRQATQPVREWDSRGRHTTTHRELVPLAGGAVLLDTPGLRLLKLWSAEDGIAGVFPDVAGFAASCRFRDCRHAEEPGCAVRAAADSGALPAERLAAWRKLVREQEWLEARQDARLRAQREARWKAIHNSLKHHPKFRRER